MDSPYDGQYGQPWPVGARLRFKRGAPLKRQYLYLRQTPVLVLGEIEDHTDIGEGWAQRVYAFSAAGYGNPVGWATPDVLEPIPDQRDYAEDCAATDRPEQVGSCVAR